MTELDIVIDIARPFCSIETGEQLDPVGGWQYGLVESAADGLSQNMLEQYFA